MPRDRSTLTVAVLSTVLVLAAVLMIAAGLPERTLLQRRLLQLYSVPLSGALALGVVHVAGRLQHLDRRTRLVLGVAAGASLLGVAGMAAGLLLSQDALLPASQAISWLSLGFALLWVVAQLPGRDDGRTFGGRPGGAGDPAEAAAPAAHCGHPPAPRAGGGCGEPRSYPKG